MSRRRTDHLAELRRATERARAVLKPGDRIRCRRCGGLQRTYTVKGWFDDCVESVSGIYDLVPWHIDRLNGRPVSFQDGGTFRRNFGEDAA